MHRSRNVRYLLIASALLAVSVHGLSAQVDGVKVFKNRSIAASVDVKGGHLSIDSVTGLATKVQLHPEEAFVLTLQDGREMRSSTMQMVGGLEASTQAPNPASPRAADRETASQLCADLRDLLTSTKVHWCIVSRGDQPYLRQEITIHADKQPLPISDVQMFHFHDVAAKVVGKVSGSPIVSGNFYIGFEHPLSYSTTDGGEVISGLKRVLPLAAEQSIIYSSVIGVARPGQMRRDFLAYLEMERAHPYRTFLHYNTWYDLGRGERFGSAQVLDRMHAFGEELVRKRGVTLDSFLMDDGWDDTHTLWGFDPGFPDGFAPLRSTAKEYGFGIGVWLSPWGGYGKAKKERIAYGTSQGYEIVKSGYALSGPRYYEKFEESCVNFIRRFGVNQFKFDGTGNADQVFPGSLFDSDFSAAIHLFDRLRQEDNAIFINLTTGSKPSPFWLRYVDSVFRAGEDHSFSGEGDWRQQWINYRDAQTYRNIVQGGPLFPLNSLMLHGIVYAAKAKNLMNDPGNDFAAEVHSYFGSGTQLQELYITPSLLSKENWDVLAESAKWSRKNAAILKDTHWVGGDPGKNEPYGWASWQGNSAILVLRNPSSKAQQISIDVQESFELPKGSKQHYVMHSPWAADAGEATVRLDAHSPHIFQLKPFEVVTLQSQL